MRSFDDGEVLLGAILIDIVSFGAAVLTGGNAVESSTAKHCQMQGSVLLKDTLYLCQEKKS